MKIAKPVDYEKKINDIKSIRDYYVLKCDYISKNTSLFNDENFVSSYFNDTRGIDEQIEDSKRAYSFVLNDEIPSFHYEVVGGAFLDFFKNLVTDYISLLESKKDNILNENN